MSLTTAIETFGVVALPDGPITDASLIFFFQAEDGMRDYKVTGVQTCALPICPAAGDLWFGNDAGLSQWRGGRFKNFGTDDGLRSEERRVGKEGRSRWSPYH